MDSGGGVRVCVQWTGQQGRALLPAAAHPAVCESVSTRGTAAVATGSHCYRGIMAAAALHRHQAAPPPPALPPLAATHPAAVRRPALLPAHRQPAPAGAGQSGSRRTAGPQHVPSAWGTAATVGAGGAMGRSVWRKSAGRWRRAPAEAFQQQHQQTPASIPCRRGRRPNDRPASACNPPCGR